MCSDGLSDEISNDDITDVLRAGDNDQQTTDNLIRKVMKVAAEDNVTVVVVAAPDDALEYTGDEEAGESEKVTLKSTDTPRPFSV